MDSIFSSDQLPSKAEGLKDLARPEGIPVKPKPTAYRDTVKVVLVRSQREIRLYALGRIDVLTGRYGENGKEGVAWSKALSLRGHFLIHKDGGGMVIRQESRSKSFPRTTLMRLAPESRSNTFEAEGLSYRGAMEIHPEKDGRLMLVNVLDLESYLRGVLPYELGTVDRGALEALKALAVAARTYSLKRMRNPPHTVFDLYATIQDQVYKGTKSEYALSDRAIQETHGMVLCHSDTLAHCFYHSTCAGRTASKHEVWGGDSIPYLVSAPDTDAKGMNFCKASRYSSWRESWDLSSLGAIVKANMASAQVKDAPRFSSISDLRILSRAGCGRVKLLSIITDQGPVYVKGDKTRWALRPRANTSKILPSAWFEIRTSGSQAIAEGRAFGHGIGLCQMGAIGRARQGENFKQILQAYYKGANVVEYR